MADSSEIQSKPDAEIQQSKRDQQDSSFLETLVPIPDFFFNIKAEIESIGGSKWRIRKFGYILYFITLCVMFGSFAYYSLPAQRVSLESIVTSELQDVWIHIHGDSSMRMFTAALISRLNGTLMDTRFGSYTSHDKGGCQGEADPQDACFREYLDFSRRVRLTYVFKTFSSQRDTYLPKLITDSQRPTHFLFATGAWDLGYSNNPLNGTIYNTASFLRETSEMFPDSLTVFANLVACHPSFVESALRFNSLIREKIQVELSEHVALLDREADTIGVSNRSLCEGWHAYGNIVLNHVARFLEIASQRS